MMKLLSCRYNIDTNRVEVRSQGSSSRTAVQQAIIDNFKMLKKPGKWRISGLFLCLKSPDSDGEI